MANRLGLGQVPFGIRRTSRLSRHWELKLGLCVLFSSCTCHTVEENRSSALTRTWPTPYYEDDPAACVDGMQGPLVELPDPDGLVPSTAETVLNPLLMPEFREFLLVIVVSKQDDARWGPAQTARVYQRGKGLVHVWRVSSGRLGFDTPSGYFFPIGFSSRHVSSAFDAPMPWAVFFSGGYALHGAGSAQAIAQLGHPVSHGCVRLEPAHAQRLFHLMGQAGRGKVPELDSKTGEPTGHWRRGPRGLIMIGPPDRTGYRTAETTSRAPLRQRLPE